MNPPPTHITIIKKLILMILLAFPFSTALGQVQNYKVVPERCSLTFDVSAQMHKVHGVSTDFSGTISGDPKDISTAKITIRLNPGSFDTDNDKRDKVMREKSLEVEKYPFIQFESTSIEVLEKELPLNRSVDATVHGKLTLHGIEKEIAVPVRILWDERLIAADAAMEVKLDDYDVFRPKVLFFRLQNDVRVHFRIVAERQID